MFDDLETAESKLDVSDASEDSDSSSSNLYRWAHFPGMLAFVVLILLFRHNHFRWQIAIGGAYTVYVFFFAFGSVLKDADDFYGDPRVLRVTAKLLPFHLPCLALIVAGVSLWFYLEPKLPPEMTHEGRKGSMWEILGWLVLAGACMAQGFWMGGKVKRYMEATRID